MTCHYKGQFAPIMKNDFSRISNGLWACRYWYSSFQDCPSVLMELGITLCETTHHHGSGAEVNHHNYKGKTITQYFSFSDLLKYCMFFIFIFSHLPKIKNKIQSEKQTGPSITHGDAFCRLSSTYTLIWKGFNRRHFAPNSVLCFGHIYLCKKGLRVDMFF